MSFRELISAMESGSPADVIHGIAKTKPGSELAFTPRVYCRDDLVEDKAPRYDLVSEYRDYYLLENFGFSLGLVSTAFGCPHRCSFCCIENATGGRYLTHNPETVIRDIELLGDMPVVRLVDANTFGNVAQARTLCNKIQEKGIQKQFIADVRSDTVVHHPDLFREWRKAGLRSVIIGFEEIDDTKLIAINKANTTAGDFIISPDYDEQQFQNLRDYLAKNPVDLPMLSVLTPLPGTPLYGSMKEKITIHDLDYYTLFNAVLPTTMDEKAFYENYADLLKSGHSGAKI
jgi:radical SAM superfamily enzyme YgiQ (UPF0313 family)